MSDGLGLTSRRAALARLIWVNAAIVGCLVMAVMLFASTVWHTPWSTDPAWRAIMPANHFFRRFVALLLVLLVWYLFKRRFVAWLLVVIALSVSFALYWPHFDALTIAIGCLQVFCLVTMLLCHRYFCRRPDRPSLRRAWVIFVALVVFVVLDAVVGRWLARDELTLAQSFVAVFRTLFVTGGVRLVTHFMVAAFWASFAVGLLLVLRPVIFRVVVAPHVKQRARELVVADSQNSASYLALEDDKMLFFSESAPGVVAYAITGDYAIVLGDPICAEDDFPAVLREFVMFCAEGDYTAAFLSTTSRYLAEYAAMGFDRIKAGEEACVDLTTFELSGAARAKMRSKYNGATHSGVTVHEYRLAEHRDPAIEHAFDRVSAEWLGDKKSGELTFTQEEVNLHEPMDRRYFYAMDKDGEIVAFHVFLPYAAMKGYMVDVTRRRPSAPPGVTEKITVEAFLKFKAEGCLYASLGVAPLAELGEDDNHHPVADRALGLIYEKGNRFYGFKALHRAKNKYGPEWRPVYWVYPRGALTHRMIMAVIKVQNPGGFTDYFKGFFRQLMPAR